MEWLCARSQPPIVIISILLLLFCLSIGRLSGMSSAFFCIFLKLIYEKGFPYIFLQRAFLTVYRFLTGVYGDK